jgi:hypothetical protein
VVTTTTDHRVWYHLYLILLVRQADYIVNLSDFYSYRLIGKLTVFFSDSGVQLTMAHVSWEFFDQKK